MTRCSDAGGTAPAGPGARPAALERALGAPGDDGRHGTAPARAATLAARGYHRAFAPAAPGGRPTRLDTAAVARAAARRDLPPALLDGAAADPRLAARATTAAGFADSAAAPGPVSCCGA